MTPTFPPAQSNKGATAQGSAPAAQVAQFRSDGVTAQTGLRIPFFSESFSRAYGFPSTELVNMISEATQLREERPYVPFVGLREIRYSRPGLVNFGNVGTGPFRGLFSQPNVGHQELYGVTGTQLYREGALIATLPGTDMVRFASSASQVVFVSGGVAWCIAAFGGTFAQIAGLPPVSDVAYLGGYFVFSVAGSDTFYFSAVNDATTIPALNFQSAESFPDPIVGLAVWADGLVAFGSTSVQFFTLSTDPAAPFTPNEGRTFQRGCAARDAIVQTDNSVIYVSDNREVYRVENMPTRISSNSIEDKLRQCTNIAGLTAFDAVFDGHDFYVLNIPGVGSYAYDFSRIATANANQASFERGEWAEWQSHGRPNFRAKCSLSLAGKVFVGDDQTNDLWVMTPGVYADGTDPLTRKASAFIKIESGKPRCDNLVLHCVMGVGNATGAGVNPVVEMRYSDDQGRTFGKWRQAEREAAGVYGRRAFWSRLGLMRAPGRLVEVRVTDPVNVAFSHMTFNEPAPAR